MYEWPLNSLPCSTLKGSTTKEKRQHNIELNTERMRRLLSIYSFFYYWKPFYFSHWNTLHLRNSLHPSSVQDACSSTGYKFANCSALVYLWYFTFSFLPPTYFLSNKQPRWYYCIFLISTYVRFQIAIPRCLQNLFQSNSYVNLFTLGSACTFIPRNKLNI